MLSPAPGITRRRRDMLLQGLAGYGGLCAPGLLSRFLPGAFPLFVLSGLGFPLVRAGLALTGFLGKPSDCE